MSEDAKKAQIEKAYDDLEGVIRKLVSLEISDTGLVTDFVVGVAIQAYDDEGNMLDTVEPILPQRGRLTPRYRIFGILKDLTVQYDAVAAAGLIASLHNHGGDDEEDGASV